MNDLTSRAAGVYRWLSPSRETVFGIDTINGQLLGSAAGGMEVVTLPFAFDTPNLLTGVPVCTTQVGDVLLEAAVYVTTGFDGATPRAHVAVAGQPASEDLNSCFVASASSTRAGGALVNAAGPLDLGGTGYVFGAAVPITLRVDNNAGGAPGSTMGAGYIVVILVHAG